MCFTGTATRAICRKCRWRLFHWAHGNRSGVRPPFTVTRSAIEAIEHLGGVVRIGVGAGGCCGQFWTFSLGGKGADTSVKRFGCPGAWLEVVDPALELLTGATLDYGARLKPPRFRVLRNPNTAEVCPCKRSFGSTWPGPRQPGCRSYEPMPWDMEFEPPVAWRRQTGWHRV